MLHAVAGKNAVLARVEPNRNRHHHGALGKAETLDDGRVRVGVRERLFELRERLPVERRVPLELRFDVDRLCHAGSLGQAIGTSVSRRAILPVAGVAKLAIRG